MSGEPPRPGAIPGWGQQPAEPEHAPETSPPPGQPVPPGATPGAAPASPIPGWGDGSASGPAASPGPTWPPGPPAPTQPSSEAPPAPPPAASGWGAAAPSPATPATGPGGASTQGPAPGSGPGQWNPAPAPASGGCLKAFLIVVVLAAIGLGVLVVAFVLVGNRFADQLGVGEEAQCEFLSRDEARAVLGSDAEVLELSGFYEGTIGIVLDTRVLRDAADCWITSDGSEAVGRVARYEAADAAARFRAERENAAGRSDDRGGGVTVETDGYFGGEVTGLGDEAFCTGVSPAIQAGVLARQGNTLVYASLSAIEGTRTDYESTAEGVVISPATCAKAQELARAMLD